MHPDIPDRLPDHPAVRKTAAATPHADRRPTTPASWNGLVRRYRRPLAAVARRLLRLHGLPATPDDVQDLLQDLWCRLLERAPELPARGTRSILGYLLSSLRHLAVDRRRAARAEKRGGSCSRAASELLRSLPAVAPSPEQRFLAVERRRRLLARCRPLAGRSSPRRDLLVLERALFDGWSSRRIARALGGRLAPSSVDSLLHRLRRRCAEQGIELPRR